MKDTSELTEVSLQLRFGDMDINRHINNVQYARLFEEARVRSVSGWIRDGYDEVAIHIARQEIEFITPLQYTAEPITAKVWVSRIGGSSFDFSSSLHDEHGKAVALCETTVVVVEANSGTVMTITDEMREFLDAKLADPAPFRRRS